MQVIVAISHDRMHAVASPTHNVTHFLSPPPLPFLRFPPLSPSLYLYPSLPRLSLPSPHPHPRPSTSSLSLLASSRLLVPGPLSRSCVRAECGVCSLSLAVSISVSLSTRTPHSGRGSLRSGFRSSWRVQRLRAQHVSRLGGMLSRRPPSPPPF
jgi:hypothetical protein